MWFEATTTRLVNEHLTIWLNWPNDWAVFWVLTLRCIWLYVIIMSRMSFRVNPHSIVWLNVKKLLARRCCNISSLSDSNVIWTHNHLVRKRTLNHVAKYNKFLDIQANYRLWIDSETCTWHDNNIQSNTPSR